MNTAWYFLQLEDDDETLYRCSPTGFQTVPLRPLDMDKRPDDLAAPVQAATPESHIPQAPGTAGTQSTGDRPRATRVVDDAQMAGDPTGRYLRQLSQSVREAIAVEPAPLYVVAEQRLAALYEMIGRNEIEGILHRPTESPSALWAETRALAAQA
jgi:hypothetical protein